MPGRGNSRFKGRAEGCAGETTSRPTGLEGAGGRDGDMRSERLWGRAGSLFVQGKDFVFEFECVDVMEN